MNQEMTARLKVKTNAIQYFNAHSKLWASRYSDPGNGQILWDRHRSILEFIDEWQPELSARFLDVGCGNGLLTFDLARRGFQGVGIDGAPSMVAGCRDEAARSATSERWHYEQADVENIPFTDQSFDVVTCVGVIEYLPDDGALLREVRRILRPGGRFLLCVTNRYGYSTSMYPLFQTMKHIPGFMTIATAVRRASTGRREMMNLPYTPRRHSPAQIRRTLEDNGFLFEKDMFSGFTLFPGPLNVSFSKLESQAAARLSRLDRTFLRRFGTFYLVSLRVA